MFFETKMNVFELSCGMEPYLISWADFPVIRAPSWVLSVSGNSLCGPGFKERLRTNLMVWDVLLCFHLTH